MLSAGKLDMSKPLRLMLSVVVFGALVAMGAWVLGTQRPKVQSSARPIEELFPSPAPPSSSRVRWVTSDSTEQPQEGEAVAVEAERLVIEINSARERAGVPPLASDAALDRVAAERAAAIGERGELPSEAESARGTGQLQRKLAAAGYAAHGWGESLLVTAGDAATVVDYWREQPDFADAMRADYRDLGLGVARFRGVPLYVILVAWPEREAFAREIRGLSDLAAIRAEMLAAINQIRRANGRAPLTANPKLERAAQLHAEDLLAQSYYDHTDRQGRGPGERVRAQGYAWEVVAENLAAGHSTVREALDAWMKSSGHRRNLLAASVDDFGLGVAVGPYDHRYRVIWVQEFAHPLAGR